MAPQSHWDTRGHSVCVHLVTHQGHPARRCSDAPEGCEVPKRARDPQRTPLVLGHLQCAGGRGDVGNCISWAPCVSSSRMEKLAGRLINAVHIKWLGVGGDARQGGAEQGSGSMQPVLSGLNPGC